MRKILVILLVLVLLCNVAGADPGEEYGYIYIPYLDLKMPIFIADPVNQQTVIDTDQAALYYQWQTANRIMDHAFSDGVSGIWNIQKIIPGTYAYLYIREQVYYYECYMTAYTEYHADQEYINGKIITPCSSYDLMIGCCAEDIHHHYVAVFRRLNNYESISN